jgi:hypothetical protein
LHAKAPEALFGFTVQATEIRRTNLTARQQVKYRRCGDFNPDMFISWSFHILHDEHIHAKQRRRIGWRFIRVPNAFPANRDQFIR